MAVLTNAQRAAAWQKLMQDMSNDPEGTRESCGITKTDLRAALDAADSWADSNAASYNSALPLPARTTLTSKQKARLLLAVIEARWKVT